MIFQLPTFCVLCGYNLKANEIQAPTVCDKCKEEEHHDSDQ